MNTFRLRALVLTGLLSANAFAADQCNFTAECKTTYGPSATDCVNSKSATSVCYCGNLPCDETGSGVDPTVYLPVPGKIEAEDFNNAYDTTAGNSGGAYKQGNVDIQSTSDSGGGYNVGWIATGEWLEYPIDVAQTNQYRIAIRTAAASATGLLTVELNATPLAQSVSLPATGAWQSWQTHTVNLGTLTKGKHVLRLQVAHGGFNLNWIDIQPSSSSNEDLLGKFDRNRDLLLAMFHSKPDPDDIHSVAGLGTLLKDSRFANVHFHAVSGAYGIQGGQYIEANRLFDLAFGAANWSNAHSQYQTALNKITSLAKTTLQAGGDI